MTKEIRICTEIVIRFLKKIKSHSIECYKRCTIKSNIQKYVAKGNLRAIHISAFSYNNAGDTILPVILKDLFNESIGVEKWKDVSVHSCVTKRDVKKYNKRDFIVIGGGGLFLKDTNPNKFSGWQWSCPINELKKISVPIIMFAVGYNRFRGQDDFDEIFIEHLNTFVDKAVFVGLRNHGSVNKIKSYLSFDLQKKVVFQPCMTTLISKIYPNLMDFRTKEDFVAINCAFDRMSLRNIDESLCNKIARVIKKLSKTIKIKYYSHMEDDKKILKYFDDLKIAYEIVEMKESKKIIYAYSKPKLVIGMRGHAQMIPFGCNTPILSIISHDKMQWFLDDVGHPDWGVDVLDQNFEVKLYENAMSVLNNTSDYIRELVIQQDRFWNITLKNLEIIKEQINKK